MSRYTIDTDDGHIAYGYSDEYFIQEFVGNECLWSVGNYYTDKCHPNHPDKTRYSNSEILDLFIIYKIPEKHRLLLLLDLPL